MFEGAWKLFQRKLYSWLSSKCGLPVCIVGLLLVLISAFQFGEVSQSILSVCFPLLRCIIMHSASIPVHDRVIICVLSSAHHRNDRICTYFFHTNYVVPAKLPTSMSCVCVRVCTGISGVEQREICSSVQYLRRQLSWKIL